MTGISARQLLYVLLAIFLSVLVVTVAGILYTNHVSRENDRRWCSVLVTIDDAYKQALNNPNITPASRRIGEEFHKLRVQFGC